MVKKNNAWKEKKGNNKWWMNSSNLSPTWHQAINCILCKSIKVRFQRMDKAIASFLYEQFCWFIQFCTHDRRKHDICQTKSFSKLQAHSYKQLSWELLDQAFRSTEQLAAKSFGATGHLWTLSHYLFAYIHRAQGAAAVAETSAWA